MSQNFRGENNPCWRGGKSSLYEGIKSLDKAHEWRVAVFIRDNFTCQNCNKKSENDLNAHHITPFKNILSDFLNQYSQFSPIEDKETLIRLAISYKPFWSIDSGETLCEGCHKNIHQKVANALANKGESGGVK